MRRSPLLRRALRWGRLVVAVGLVAFLASRAGLGDLATVGALSWWWIALGAALTPASVAVRAFNHTLLLNRHAHVVGPWQAMRLALVGAGLGLFLPQGAADLAKAHYGWRTHGHAEDMIVSSMLDKLTSITAVAAMGVLGATLAQRWPYVWLAAALTLMTLVPIALPKAMPWRLLLRFLAPGATVEDAVVVRSARPPLPLLAKVYATSIVGWLFTYAIIYCTVRAVGVSIGFGTVLMIAPVSSIARFVPISAGGIGLGEVTMAALLAGQGVAQDAAARSALLSMLLLVFGPGAAGLVLLGLGKRQTEKPAEEEAEEASAEGARGR